MHETLRDIEMPDDRDRPSDGDWTNSEPDEPSDLEDECESDSDDSRWEVFLADDDERDPLPEPGDIWVGDEGSRGRG